MGEAVILGWTLVALVGVMTPGLDTILVLRHTLLSDRKAGFATVVGITGGFVWATASLAGLTALLAASQLAYNVVRIAGAVYLLGLGGSAIWRSLPSTRLLRVMMDTVASWQKTAVGTLVNDLDFPGGRISQ